MKIINHYHELAMQRFSNDTVKGVTGRVAIGRADQALHFCMRIFTIEPGGFTPRHTHDWEHEIFVHAGSGEILETGAWRTIRSGSIVFIPGNEEHQMRNNGTEDLVFACLVPHGAPEL